MRLLSCYLFFFKRISVLKRNLERFIIISDIYMIADDSAILYAHKDPSHIAAKLGKQLESCSNWLVDNKLSLHLGKTECMLFGPPRKLKNVENFKVKC